MLNSHQILAGARTKGGIQTYVNADYATAPTVALSGSTFTFTGAIEFDGETYNLASYPFVATTLTSLLVDGSYTLSAVPAYTEPADRATAEGLGLNYYVDTNGMGDSLVHYFLPSALEASVTTAGGYDNLYKLMAMGSATNAQVQLVNSYSDAVERLSDPRYVGKLFDPTGVAYVLTRNYAQNNSSKTDALVEVVASRKGQLSKLLKVIPSPEFWDINNSRQAILDIYTETFFNMITTGGFGKERKVKLYGRDDDMMSILRSIHGNWAIPHSKAEFEGRFLAVTLS